MQYSDFKEQASSEKLTLATLDASKRLMGWQSHTGSVYKLTGITFAVIASLEDSGTAYQESDSTSLSAGEYFYDRGAGTLYVRVIGSGNPNARFLVATFRLYFASAPVSLPHDLASGYEVFWEPMIKTNSDFGVEIDTINQASEAIEGTGTLTLHNDNEFWPKQFDKLYYENCACLIYSYNRDLEPSDAHLIYRGYVTQKAYAVNQITFQLADVISQLKSPIDLGVIADLGLRTGDSLAQARQRLVLGRVFGHKPVNTDQVLDGYPVSGTVSIVYDSPTLNGTGTLFLKEMSPDDRLILDGVEYTVSSVTSDTVLTLTENYSDDAGLTAATITIIPELPKRWINRTWNIAGHAVREPVTAVANGSSITTLFVDDGEDIYADDFIYVGELGSGDLVQVRSVTGKNIVNLRTSLQTIPAIGTKVTRPAVQNVRIDDVTLAFWDDYTFDAETATLTLRDTAEANSAPIRNLTQTLVFTNGSRTVTGSGLKTSLKPGYLVGIAGNAVFFEVLSIESDTSLTLRTPATYSATTTGRYKALVFNPDDNELSVDVLGKTQDGDTNGALLKTAPRMVEALLKDIGLGDLIDSDSFTRANERASMHLGLVFPKQRDTQTAPTYREAINAISVSVMGSLIQTDALELAYDILRPSKPQGSLRLSEADILSWKFESTAAKVVKTSIVQYRPKEYDYLTADESVLTKQQTSDTAQYLARSTREQTMTTYLVDELDAGVLANRWSFLLENSAGRATVVTKLQGMNCQVGDIIEVEHRKFFERYGLSLSSRLFYVEGVAKNGSQVKLTLVDLSNAFSRIAAINDLSNPYADATDREKLFGGYYTDDYGLIDNDPESFGTNLIW